MCGIFGAVAREGNVSGALLEGLRRLEYRGYDSAGLAVVTTLGELEVRRAEGRLDALAARVAEKAFGAPALVGVGHTRWATHGPPVERNAHPHRDCGGELVVVHNGIIENYLELRRDLAARGHRFASDTDTEVLAHLVEENLRTGEGGPAGAGPLARAVHASLPAVRGAYALVVLSRRHPGTLVAARADVPLCLGIAPDAIYCASDVPAFLDRTREVVFLHNGEVAEISAEGFRIRRLDGGEVERKAVRVDWDAAAAERGGYPHFMLKEIHEQPDVLAAAAFDRLDEARGDVRFEDPFFDEDARWKSVSRVDLVACGSALHAGFVGRFFFERLARLHAQADFASEYRYRAPLPADGALFLAISQSGETADTLGAAREAARRGLPVAAIVNAVGSTLWRESDAVVGTHAGPEVGVAATKTFLAQLVALYLLAIRAGRARGALTAEEGRTRIHDLRALRAHLGAVLDGDTRAALARIADREKDAKGFLFLGRGLQYPIALEGALKLKEISYLHAEGYPAGEMKHGPIALVEKSLPVVALATRSPLLEKTFTNMQEVRARGGRLIALSSRGDGAVAAVADEVLEVPSVPEDLAPLVNVVPLQLLAYEIALRRGCDIDMPRNLAKSVTVE
ncbi:MAG TPA: glutamine--fructose-6-phosphate transaminase (isomerizing) [Planctomycetota bacterium]|jgi:glucosamine--fructose-6-phosphate aminotransferase (isomerizing)|nr:glutamine--fructose-6-phosphate transaminase (isomerizing) [Planctomycetota bacterium]